MSLILKELGYGTALFHWSGKHQAAGVRCPAEYSYLGSGYCFIETVKPIIPTEKPDHYWIFNGGGLPDNPLVIKVGDGNSLDLGEEYGDAQFAKKVEAKGRVLAAEDYYPYMRLADKYGIRFDDE